MTWTKNMKNKSNIWLEQKHEKQIQHMTWTKTHQMDNIWPQYRYVQGVFVVAKKWSQPCLGTKYACNQWIYVYLKRFIFFPCGGGGNFFIFVFPSSFQYVFVLFAMVFLEFFGFPICFPRVFLIVPHFIPHPLPKVLPSSPL